MTSMREKIAERLMRHYAEGGPYDGFMEADAVLDVLMKPTAEMIEEGRWPAEDDGPLACFRAMITAAKEGK